MADHRFIKTRIWQDNWFAHISEEGQRLFLYLITNRNTRICGYYELPMFEICAHMRWDEEKVTKILKELEPKIIYFKEWVGIMKYPEHQNVANNSKVQAAIERELSEVPAEVLSHKSEVISHKSETIDRSSIGHTYPIPQDKKTAKTKDKYGEFGRVLLTKDEWGKLVDKVGERQTNELIFELDTYIASKGKKYSSHYATLLNWARRKGFGAQSNSKYGEI